MTRDEAKKIIRILSDAYPNYHPQDLSSTIDTWAFMLEEYPYQQIAIALKAYITSDASGFAPSVGQLLDKLRTITAPIETTGIEAWAQVFKAVCNSCYNAESEFEKLPVLTQKTIGSPAVLREWSQLGTEEVQTVIHSNFLRNYEATKKRQKELECIPQDVKSSLGITMEDVLRIADYKKPVAIEENRNSVKGNVSAETWEKVEKAKQELMYGR